MRTPLLRGRDFNDHDDAASAPVALVTAAFAAGSYFGGDDPIGRRFQTEVGPGQISPRIK